MRKIILSIILIFLLVLPCSAEETNPSTLQEDSVEEIVADYKALQLAFRAGKVNQAGYIQAMHMLEVRATLHKVISVRKLMGSKVPIEEQMFFLEDHPPKNEDEQIFRNLIKIFGYQNAT